MIKHNRRKVRPFSHHRRLERQGVATVEFVVVLTFLLIPVIFGCLELLRVQMIRNQAHVASYEAARYCMVPGSTVAEAEARALQFMSFMGPLEPVIQCNPSDSSGTAQDEINDFTSQVQVTVAVPIDESFLLGIFFSGKTLRSQTTLTFESYSGFYDGSSN